MGVMYLIESRLNAKLGFTLLIRMVKGGLRCYNENVSILGVHVLLDFAAGGVAALIPVPLLHACRRRGSSWSPHSQTTAASMRSLQD